MVPRRGDVPGKGQRELCAQSVTCPCSQHCADIAAMHSLPRLGPSACIHAHTHTHTHTHTHHLSLARQVGSIKLYLNGVLMKKGYAIDHKGAIPKTATNVAWIGNRPADQSGSYQGTISSAYMWSRELSATEISQLYHAGRLGTTRAVVKPPPPPTIKDKSYKIWNGCVLRHEYALVGHAGDVCGGDNPGSLQGGAKIVKGDGLRLSGAKADKVIIAKPTTLPAGSSARTSAAWVKTKSNSARQFIISYGSTSGASHKHWDFELNGWVSSRLVDRHVNMPNTFTIDMHICARVRASGLLISSLSFLSVCGENGEQRLYVYEGTTWHSTYMYISTL